VLSKRMQHTSLFGEEEDYKVGREKEGHTFKGGDEGKGGEWGRGGGAPSIK
jgi:hypothetical protein